MRGELKRNKMPFQSKSMVKGEVGGGWCAGKFQCIRRQSLTHSVSRPSSALNSICEQRAIVTIKIFSNHLFTKKSATCLTHPLFYAEKQSNRLLGVGGGKCGQPFNILITTQQAEQTNRSKQCNKYHQGNYDEWMKRNCRNFSAENVPCTPLQPPCVRSCCLLWVVVDGGWVYVSCRAKCDKFTLFRILLFLRCVKT